MLYKFGKRHGASLKRGHLFSPVCVNQIMNLQYNLQLLPYIISAFITQTQNHKILNPNVITK